MSKLIRIHENEESFNLTDNNDMSSRCSFIEDEEGEITCGASFNSTVPEPDALVARCFSDDHDFCALFMARMLIRSAARTAA